MQASDYPVQLYDSRQLVDKFLDENRSVLKLILLSIVTLGIYLIIFFYYVGDDVNIIAGRYDRKTTMNYFLLAVPPLVVPPLLLLTGVVPEMTMVLPFPNAVIIVFSFGVPFVIAMFVWMHRVSNRIGVELKRRGLGYEFSARHYWLWFALGSLIIVGPFVYIHKLCKAMNMLAEDYHANDWREYLNAR